MANNYLQFSEVIPQLTTQEADWLRTQLEVVCVFGEHEHPEDKLPPGLDRDKADWIGCRAYRDMPGYDPEWGEDAGFLFDVEWDFPAFEPPDYLRQLSPELYRQECQRVQARFDEAVRLAEEAFLSELAKLVSHLTDRLSGSEDGKPKVFRDSAVENLRGFFERFRQLNIGSNEQLDELVGQCQQIVQGIQPQDLRDRQSLRQHVSTQLSGVQSVLDGLLVDRPRRNILRRPK
ncbi:MAG: hypothetical protein IID44_32655 [Planctomycetes bacterium]|nr:hypothetical protein [Planctomycetota bacterium]